MRREAERAFGERRGAAGDAFDNGENDHSYARSSQAEPLTVGVTAGYPRSAGESISLSAPGSCVRPPTSSFP